MLRSLFVCEVQEYTYTGNVFFSEWIESITLSLPLTEVMTICGGST